MEVEVANGAFPRGSLLSVRIGDTRKQATLSFDSKISFATGVADAGTVQVDIFQRVGSCKIAVTPDQEVYNLSVSGDGFEDLALRFGTSSSENGLKQRLADAVAQDEYIDQHDLKSFAHDSLSPSQHNSSPVNMSQGGDQTEAVRRHANDYIEKFELRKVLQELFQRVIKDKPDDPYLFMQSVLSGSMVGGATPESTLRVAAVVSPLANPAEEAARIRASDERQQEQIALQQKQINAMQRHIQALTAQAQGGGGGISDRGLSTQPSVNTEVNTHMLGRLLASTYAPPVPPTMYYETRDGIDMGTDNGDKKTNPSLLVDIVDCSDKMSNGTYASVGEHNKRPLYRLLGPEPRYLYYWDDPAWAGWWIADKLGSEDYVEWFKSPAEAQLPTYCQKGELGSKVSEIEMSAEVTNRISMISNQAEKDTIRKKFGEAFGHTFTKLEGTNRGLMSKTSPVVGIAQALESQQRALQVLHSQLSAETQRREAAEAHAQTMEEAFETLQLRITMAIPEKGESALLQQQVCSP